MKKRTPRFPRLIAVIHLPPLPGAPGAFGEDPAAVIQEAGIRAVREAQALEKLGFDALILENFGDTPFYKSSVPPETTAAMSVIASAVRESVRIPLGINVLRNDARAAIAIAAVSGADFVRVNILSGVAATDQGLIEGEAAVWMRELQRLGVAHRVAVFGDVLVKHAKTLSQDRVDLAIEEVALRAGASGVILTGETTGRSIDEARVKEAGACARHLGVPVFAGSGTTAENLPFLMEHLTGVIVGSTLRQGGVAGAPLDLARCKKFLAALKSSSSKKTSRKAESRTKLMMKKKGSAGITKQSRAKNSAR